MSTNGGGVVWLFFFRRGFMVEWPVSVDPGIEALVEPVGEAANDEGGDVGPEAA